MFVLSIGAKVIKRILFRKQTFRKVFFLILFKKSNAMDMMVHHQQKDRVAKTVTLSPFILMGC